MNKQEILNKYSKEDDKLLIAKVLDKVEYTINKNKISYTDFLDLRQINIVEKMLNRIKVTNYKFFGGLQEEAERKIIIFIPENLDESAVEKNYNEILSIIRITLPNELIGKYEHRDYLGGLMKLGLKREKIGDIIVYSEGADILVLNEITKFCLINIQELTRFSKSKIELKKVEDIKKVDKQKQEIKITVSSMRLDNIVSELANTSRAKAVQIINEGRIFVNFENEYKVSKILNIGDIITIRGKGRFKLIELVGNTKKQKCVIKVEKYI